MKRISHTYTLTALALLIFAAGLCVGYFILSWRPAVCLKKYTYVNSDVVCGSPDVIAKTGYSATQSKIAEYIAEQKKSGAIADASVYFRDLKHGPTFGINELADFAPASLLKLPLALVYLTSAEAQPELLTTKMKWTGESHVYEQRIQPKVTAKEGLEYSIEDLLKMMLIHSDNASYAALEQFLSDSPHRSNLRLRIFQEIGLIDPRDRVEETITVRGYASIFRLLYNASYLNAEFSEQMLKWLSESDYAGGLNSGVPEGTRVAHKFGERFLGTKDLQLHDCGVVYFPSNPYLICIMTKGSNWDSLEKTIRDISGIVYEEVDSRRF